ncbi:hypothetical protein [Nocardia callitridis]|uniref:ESX-1 secretion-associated protein EspA/EspE-like domain-containing protein n=1 Tax=Nocardia callitridis TaxID=648753 RepID=A0ABP9KCM2_9NOCA
MRSLDTGVDTGVIAPESQSALHAVDHSASQSVGEQAAADGMQDAANQAFVDVSLPQLPEDLPPVEPPEFWLSRKVSEDTQNGAGVPGGMPGPGGLDGGDPSGLPSDVSALLGDTGASIQQAAAPLTEFANGALGSARGALNNALGGASSSGAAPASAAAPDIAAMPADPAAALTQGLAVAGLPGVDVLMKPILDLLNSFGTGVMGALDPTQILNQSSKLIDSAMQVGKGAMSTVEQVWQGKAANSAQTASQQATTEGQETSQRGIDISEITQRAASVVQQGNSQLLSIAASFATQASTVAPVILTPPAQAYLMGLATDHLGHAVSVVNSTRGDLAGKTAELNGAVSQLMGPEAQQAAQSAAENIGQPVLDQAQGMASEAGSNLSSSGLDSSSPGLSTTTASAGSPHIPGLSTGAPGPGPGPGLSSMPKIPGLPGSGLPSIPGMPGVPGMAGMPFGPGAGSTAPGGSSFMGPGPGPGRGGGDDEHGRTVQPYQSRTGNDDLTGPLGESTPDVIGATHSDEMVGSDYENDQF